MIDSEPRPNRAPQITLIGLLVVALLVVAISSGVFFDLVPSDSGAVQALTAMGLATVTPTPVEAPRAAATTAPPTPTVYVTPTPPPRVDHYVLLRPISSQHNNLVARFYPYGSRGGGGYPIHRGVDMVNALGTPVLAAADGQVVFAGEDLARVVGARSAFYGNAVIIEHTSLWGDAPIYTVYGHLSEVRVQEGDEVRAGQVIALVGEEGVAEGPHLHFEVRYGENAYSATVNPELWMQPLEDRGTLAAWIGVGDHSPVPELYVVLARASQPHVALREALTYPEAQVNPDPSWGENLVVGDLPAGDWVLSLYYRGVHRQEPFTIRPGATTFVMLQLAP